jgi:hypothetical protein
MTTQPVSPQRKALDYAETQLGVTRVYEEALDKRNEFDELMTALGEARDKKRIVEGKIQDREFEVMGDERSAHPEMSAAAMDKHLKLAYHKDSFLQLLREEHTAVVNELDGLELDRAVLDVDIRIAVARLTELGGYLNFLAAIKNQATNT